MKDRPSRRALSSPHPRPPAARPKLLPRGPSCPAAGMKDRPSWRVPRGPSCPAAGGLLRAWCSGFSPQTASRPSWRALSSSRLRPLRCEAEASAARNIASRGWRAPSSLSSGFSPRTPSRPSWRALSSSHLRPLVARPRLPPRGPSRPAAGGLLRAWLSGFSPRTPSRPSWRALSSSHLRPLRREAEASAAGAITPRGWRAHSSLV